MGIHPPYPSFTTPDPIDDFFVAGRNLWPDLADLKQLTYDREQVPDEVVRFLRSTCLNEHGVAHYLGSYFHNYHNDFKLRFWSAMWTAEEYTHYIVLRRIIQGLGDDLTPRDFAGLEDGDYVENFLAYLDDIRVDKSMDSRMLQLIYGVLQEYGAVIAYTAAAEQCNNEGMAKILRRIAKDEMRHCRFNQVALEAMMEHCSEDEKALVWPQFRAIWGDLQMPTEHIHYFSEIGATDLYTSLWDGEKRSKIILYLSHYFQKYRQYTKDPATT